MYQFVEKMYLVVQLRHDMIFQYKDFLIYKNNDLTYL